MTEEEKEKKVETAVYALVGQNQNKTIKIQEEASNKILVILIDIESTHSFIDYQVAKEVKAILAAANPLIVTVANEHKILSKLKCVNFK